jgi:hypothetical protein
MVRSPLSAGGFGRHERTSNAETNAAVARNGTLREVVFLMRTVRPPDYSGQTKKPLPLTLCYRGLLVYNTKSVLVGIVLILSHRVRSRNSLQDQASKLRLYTAPASSKTGLKSIVL